MFHSRGATVTEEEWLNAKNASPLLYAAKELSSQRKFRLFAIALARSLFRVITHPDLSWGIEIAEQLAEGTARDVDVERAREIFGSMTYVQDYEARGIVGENYFLANFIWESLRPLKVRSRIGAHLSDYVEDIRLNPQCGVAELRDIFGNPFRPVVFELSWRTSNVMALANGMHEARDFAAMPILADALQDAGCDDEQLLGHCRSPDPHVRGCWVLDLIRSGVH